MKQLYNNILENIEALLVGLLIVVMPTVFFKTLDPVLYPRYLVLSIWVVIMLLVLGYRIWTGKFKIILALSHKIIFGSAALFVLLNALSSFGVINASEAIYKTFKELTLVLSFFMFFQVLKNNDKATHILIKSFIIATIIFLVIGISQLLDADFSKLKSATANYDYWFRQATGHVKSTLASVNPFASYLVLSLGFSIYGSIVFRKVWRVISILTVVVSVLFVILLASKASWGSLGLAFSVAFLLLVVYLFFILPKRSGSPVGFWAKYLIAVVPFLLFYAGFYVFEKSDNRYVGIVITKVQQVLSPELSENSIYNSDNPTSGQMRTLVWANTIQMARENPFLGIGPGQWRIEYAKYGVDAFNWELRNGAVTFQRTHNDFLWILGEVGFVGLILYLIVFIGSLIVAFSNMLTSTDRKKTILNGLLFAFLIGFIINLFVSFPRERITHNLTYLVMFALILSSVKSEKVTFFDKRKLIVAITALFLVLAGFNTRIAIDMVKGDKAAVYLKVALANNNIPVMARGVRMVRDDSFYTLDPFSAPVPFYKASVLHRQNNLKQAKKEFLKAYELHPYHLRNLCNLGTACNMLNDREDALRYYEEALAISPRFEEALMDIAIVHHNLNNSEKAINYIGQVPVSSKNPPKFEHNYVTICRKRAIDIANQLDIPKVNVWLKDENKIKATFVRFQKGNDSFDKILLQELGK